MLDHIIYVSISIVIEHLTYLQKKNESAVSLTETADQKILQFDWLKTMTCECLSP